MKIAPTLEGGLRIDAEDAADWHLLSSIADDAVDSPTRLADRLGSLVSDPDVAGDWREFIVPELHDGFQSDVARIAALVENARVSADNGPGSLRITREEGLLWYGVLNQARLAIEERHRFGPGESIDPATLPPLSRAAFFRTRFYCAIQSILLDHVM